MGHIPTLENADEQDNLGLQERGLRDPVTKSLTKIRLMIGSPTTFSVSSLTNFGITNTRNRNLPSYCSIRYLGPMAN